MRWSLQTMECVRITPAECRKIADGIQKTWKCECVDCNVNTDDLSLKIDHLNDQFAVIVQKLDKLDKIDGVIAGISEIKTDIQAIKAIVGLLEPRVSSNETDIKVIHDEIAQINQTRENYSGGGSEEIVIQEINERLFIKRNVIIFNLKESLIIGCWSAESTFHLTWPSSQYFDFASIVEELLLTSENFEPILLLGDVNLPNADWDPLGSQMHDPASQPIKGLAHMFNLTQVNGVNNERGILLDLVFSSRIDISVRGSLDRLMQVESHHPTLDITVPCFKPVTDNNRTLIYDIRRSDLFEIFRVIQGWPYPVLNNVIGDSVETAFIDFCASLSGAI
ncbi:hypothetical protein J6590_026132 [Homalodisca vitripennis]|nr:hypothetical protein J6590_026132 [Homalodisca vitripennis]